MKTGCRDVATTWSLSGAAGCSNIITAMLQPVLANNLFPSNPLLYSNHFFVTKQSFWITVVKLLVTS